MWKSFKKLPSTTWVVWYLHFLPQSETNPPRTTLVSREEFHVCSPHTFSAMSCQADHFDLTRPPHNDLLPGYHCEWAALKILCNTRALLIKLTCIPGSVQLFIDLFMSLNGDSSPTKCATVPKICAGCNTLLHLTANLRRAHKVDVPYKKCRIH